MLPRGEHSIAAYCGDDGIFAHAATETLLVDSSTIDVDSCQKLHDEAQARGFRLVDAPVSGGISGAAAGTLTFMVGGADAHVNEAKQYIEPMAGNIIATGGPTSGEAAKICNNLMLFINLAGACEGAVLAERLGLDKQTFWDIASVSSGESWAMRTWYPIPGIIETSAANNDYEATFSTDLANKDINLAIAASETTETPLEVGKYVQTMFQRLADAGMGGKDCSMIVKLVDGSFEG
jgi:3-hydroxyisobutyrate dehydrogenase